MCNQNPGHCGLAQQQLSALWLEHTLGTIVLHMAPHTALHIQGFLVHTCN